MKNKHGKEWIPHVNERVRIYGEGETEGIVLDSIDDQVRVLRDNGKIQWLYSRILLSKHERVTA